MEFVEDSDLFNHINSTGMLTEEKAMHLFRQIMSAIGYCHSLNICHRDLKPENILITNRDVIKVADFGMAALHQNSNHALRTSCGSPHYAAPELLRGQAYRGDKADVWSLGVIFFAMIAARLPFDDPNMALQMEKAKVAMYDMPRHISNEAKDLIFRMLCVDPARRLSINDMWRHPLIRRYDYLDDLAERNGLPLQIRDKFRYSAIPYAEIDSQLVRQLRSMWHMMTDKEIKARLARDEWVYLVQPHILLDFDSNLLQAE